MFSLIITIISIALVAALAVASVYYGGSAFSQGSAKASASTLVAQAQQIAGANTLYANDNGGTFAQNVDDLVPEYLSAAPIPSSKVAVGSWEIGANNVITLDLVDGATEVAGQIDAQAGVTGTRPATVPTTGGSQFGVTAAVEGEVTDLGFFYKG